MILEMEIINVLDPPGRGLLTDTKVTAVRHKRSDANHRLQVRVNPSRNKCAEMCRRKSTPRKARAKSPAPSQRRRRTAHAIARGRKSRCFIAAIHALVELNRVVVTKLSDSPANQHFLAKTLRPRRAVASTHRVAHRRAPARTRTRTDRDPCRPRESPSRAPRRRCPHRQPPDAHRHRAHPRAARRSVRVREDYTLDDARAKEATAAKTPDREAAA